ncbi:Hypothetical predicted protein [Olea europaea subsp. europaea]|uniref:Uncharacterized protein n=1 Tax=Olea europaea subsp. europaea TaxID=158383 RepID=A0A8S0PUJ5_OLEEU|nr:Hypothetical predicted protein [Olea europaea subsp. europaea]
MGMSLPFLSLGRLVYQNNVQKGSPFFRFLQVCVQRPDLKAYKNYLLIQLTTCLNRYLLRPLETGIFPSQIQQECCTKFMIKKLQRLRFFKELVNSSFWTVLQ